MMYCMCMYGEYGDLHDVCVCMESIETFMMGPDAAG